MRIFSIFLLSTCSVSAAEIDYARDIQPIFQQHCLQCHGPDKQKSDLRVDSVPAMIEGGNSGPALVPNKSTESLIVLAMLGSKTETVAKMPPKGTVPPEQIARIKSWIDSGAKAPKVEAATGTKKPKSAHWAFLPVKRPELPQPSIGTIRNGIDAFILDRLSKEKLKPSTEADRITQIRRLSLDLLGLLPTPQEVDEFIHDNRPNAYEQLVERLLKSPHYGERWGRHWLDQARYADSNGFTIDAGRQIWKYRDWVIDSLNRDLPYNQFVIEQLAGDLLPKATLEQKVATGFHRNTLINQEGGIDVEQFRVESVIDRVNTTGAVFLGITIGCAQCHDHKYDPFSQREYYEFYAFFNNCDEPNLVVDSERTQQERAKLAKERQRLQQQLKQIDRTSVETIEQWERAQTDQTREKLPKAVATIFNVAPNGRNEKQKQTLEKAFRRADLTRHITASLAQPWTSPLHLQLIKSRLELEKQIDVIKAKEPAAMTTMVVAERKQPRQTTIFLAGDFTRKGKPVSPGTLSVLPPLKPRDAAKPDRLDLAKWIVDPANPLTARVLVNRVWTIYFGVGFVETENDFGTQGSLPSHPELLDWLADEFVRQGYSLKALHRLITHSATYRQASKYREDLMQVDARNRLLARQNRLRLEAEVIRDAYLVSTGLLNPTVGGPSIFPPQPEGVYKFTQVDKGWKTSEGADRFRRGMYTYFWRSAPHPALSTFDAPDASVACTRRSRSNIPTQALTLLNDTGFHEYAQAFAARLLKEGSMDDVERIALAYRFAFGRSPSERERQRLLQFLQGQRNAYAKDDKAATELIGTRLTNVPVAEQASWTQFSRVILNLDEFITRE
jgi:mono/diheme cytochrome c family protein